MYIERFYDDANIADAVGVRARLLLLFVNGMLLRNRVKLLGFVLFSRVFLYLVIVANVVGMAFTNAFGVAY